MKHSVYDISDPTTIVDLIVIIMLIFFIFIILLSLIALQRLSTVDTSDVVTTSSSSKVSIIIPARNEGDNIGSCLESIMDLDYENYEVLVVDGGSTDNTAQVVKSYKEVIYIEEPPKPENWIGKSWACHIGQQHASGEILMFTDADTIHSPDSLSTTVYHIKDSEGFLTLITTQILHTFWEKLLLIVFFIGTISLGGLGQKKDYAFANGQYMMFTRLFYDNMGPAGAFDAVRSSIVDDFAIGSLIAKQGKKVKIIQSQGLVYARMYRSLGEIRTGYTKNLATGMEALDVAGLIRANLITTWAILNPVFILLGLLLATQGSEWLFIGGIVGYIVFVGILYQVEQSSTGGRSYGPLIYPIYLLVYQFILFESIMQTKFRKQVSWKGRNYSIH